MPALLPLFLNLTGRDVVLIGGGPVAAAKLDQLLAVGARIRVVSPAVVPAIERAGVPVTRRAFVPADLDGAWLVIAAATPDVNREVAAAAEHRRCFVNAVDDPPNASAFLSGVVRRDGVTIAISTSGAAPALTSLLRQALDAVLPGDLGTWIAEATRQRAVWRREGVPMEARKPRLLEALNALYDTHAGDAPEQAAEGAPTEKRTGGEPPSSGINARIVADESNGRSRPEQTGHVSLVGAGPGDPALLTRKAMARLRAADLVLYDALIDDRILRYARRAQRFFVGKRAGRHAMTQRAIHGVMIRAARRGRRVVRLKGGDPFVFGRGGEEMLALERAGISFDIVPGVTSAIAAPALAGIPVTHRGVSGALLVVSGHDEETFATAIGQLRPNGVTLVVLMGLGRAAALAALLVDRGWGSGTPAAIISDASGPSQHVWRGTLQDLASGATESANAGPATIVVGEVVRLGRTQTAAVEGDDAAIEVLRCLGS
jgi:uroporphyrin-III C-methyltransferase/precorrin-2 dehydrogenase/sirohydrochlorin ferrochelatase